MCVLGTSKANSYFYILQKFLMFLFFVYHQNKFSSMFPKYLFYKHLKSQRKLLNLALRYVADQHAFLFIFYLQLYILLLTDVRFCESIFSFCKKTKKRNQYVWVFFFVFFNSNQNRKKTSY